MFSIYQSDIRGTNLRKSTAVPKLPKYGAYIRGTNLEKSAAVPRQLKDGAYIGNKSKIAATVSGRAKNGQNAISSSVQKDQTVAASL